MDPSRIVGPTRLHWAKPASRAGTRLRAPQDLCGVEPGSTELVPVDVCELLSLLPGSRTPPRSSDEGMPDSDVIGSETVAIASNRAVTRGREVLDRVSNRRRSGVPSSKRHGLPPQTGRCMVLDRSDTSSHALATKGSPARVRESTKQPALCRRHRTGVSTCSPKACSRAEPCSRRSTPPRRWRLRTDR